MACEAEQAAVDQAQANLDAALDQYDQLVDIIAGLTGVLQGATTALELCLLNGGPGTSEPMVSQSDEQAVGEMRAASRWLRTRGKK